ncbi:MAG: PAS-domain containing protein [Methylobacteriaceae bacterium]|nr:PAS-domain containing protein [Methylobacteriaceae bacterium]
MALTWHDLTCRDNCLVPAFAASASVAFPQAVSAQSFDLIAPDKMAETSGLAGILLVLGLVLFSTITALLHLTGRARWTQREAQLVDELARLRHQLDRAQVFLSAEPQIAIAWTSPTGEPDIEGDLSLVTDVPVARRVLGFGSWLAPHAAQQLETCVERLRQRGEAFRMPLTSLVGRHLEAEGRPVGGRAVMRIRDVSGDRLELIGLRERFAETKAIADALRTMLDAIAEPVWMRDAAGKLTWLNSAYLRAVEAAKSEDVLARHVDLLEKQDREAAAATLRSGQIWRAQVQAVVAGERHTLDVVDVPSPAYSVAIAKDLSELEAARADLERQMESHARTLDQMPTGVAIFDRKKRLVFNNAAYRQLWSLDQSFLDQHPTDPEILDRMRAERRLPEQADFRAWKNGLMAAYQSVETSEQPWYLPDGRTLRVVTNPNPQGGVTYLFDDVSERFHLESQFNALTRVQGETLETLKEGVAVFGTDGRLKLANPAFSTLWRVDPSALRGEPHFDALAEAWKPLHPQEETWSALREIVTGFSESRRGFERRIERSDGSVLDCAAQPLPDGATLLTFIDMTASVNVERALTDMNAALRAAEKLRNDFVHHVSYELCSPLTNIIGFIQLLGDGSIGPLNEKQREYTGYVLKSSAALLAIINDILDLATIDTGATELQLGHVDIKETIEAAAEGLQDRLSDAAIDLNIVATDNIGSFRADGKRVRQVLFNLLSNAIGFSEPGQTVTLAALRRPDEIVFKVSDRGRGIPPEILDKVFDRFESHTVGSRHRGVGLGLSIVRSFVELHGGRVLIDSAPGEGTTVTCIFPVGEPQESGAPLAERA